MATDPFAEFGGKATPPPASTPPPSGGDDPFAAFGGHALAAPSPTPMPTSQSQPDPFAEFGGRAASPENGQAAQPDDQTYGQRISQIWNDPTQGAMSRVWKILNAPTINVDSALGRSNQAGGFEKGASDLVSGLTSPLSIALTIGTFGMGGLIESGGMSALRAIGMAAPEIADVAKGAQILSDATKAGKTVQEGMAAAQAAGVDTANLTKGLDALKTASLTPDSLLSKGLLRNGGTQVALKLAEAAPQLGISAHTADLIGRGLGAATSIGMTSQQLYSAAMSSPRVFDALKDAEEETDPDKKQADYEIVKQYATDALGSFALGGLAGYHTFKESGALMDDALAKVGAGVKPSQENLILRNEANRMTAEQDAAGRIQKLWEQDIRKRYDKPSQDSLWRIRNYAESGMDPEVMAQRHNALAEAAGSDRTVSPSPQNGQPYTYNPLDTSKPVTADFYHGTKAPISSVSELDPGSHGNEQALYGLGAYLTDNPKVAEGYAQTRGKGPDGKVLPATLNNARLLDLEQTPPTNVHQVFQKTINSITGENTPLDPSLNGKQLFKKLQDELFEASYTRSDAQEVLGDLTSELRQQGYDGLRHQGGDVLGTKGSHNVAIVFPDYGVGRPLSDIVKDAPPKPTTPVTSGLSPERLQEVIAQKNLAAKYTPEEVNKLLDAYDPSKLTDAERAMAKEIRDKFNETLDFAKQNKALSDESGVRDYITNLWKDEDHDNPAVNNLVHEARSGRFAQDTTMARQRLFDNSFEGQLFGRKLATTDPVESAAHNANVFARIVAARQFKERLLDNGTRASDGMPLVALSGDSSPVTDEKGDAVMVNPNGVRSRRIADNVIQGLQANGDLDRFLAEGKIVDMTRKITPDNLPVAIDRLENSMTSSRPAFDEDGNSVILKKIQTLKDIRDGKLPISALDAINASNPHAYAWDPKGAGFVEINSPSMRKWQHIGVSPSGDNVVMQSDLLAHPEAATYLKRILGVDEKGVGEGVLGKTSAAINKEAKGVLLFGSPFHVMQIALRGIMSGVSPFKAFSQWDKWSIAKDPILRMGVENSLNMGKDYAGSSAFSEGQQAGHSAVIDKIPVLRDVQRWLNSFLFDKMIPTYKAEAYKSLFDRYQKAYPDWTPERVAREAALDTNERFGGLNYRDLGRAAATQNFFKTVALAPDWFESEARSILRTIKPEGAIARQDMLKMAAGMWITARVTNMLLSGKPHMEAPFGIVYKQDNGKENVISMRSLPSDMLHAVSDPIGFVRGRMSPLVRTADEVYSGRDSFGRKMNRGDITMDVLHNQLPLPFQAVGKTLTGMTPEVGNVGQMLNSAGLTDSIYRTEAQKKAAELASDRSESGPVDESQLARHHQIMAFEDDVRAGKMPLDDIRQLVMNGQLSQSDGKKISDNLKITHGLPADMAQLVSRSSRLPTKDLLDVYDLATPSERAALIPIVTKSNRDYTKRSMKDQTPSERAQDPTLKRLHAMFPQTDPW
jgi:hypothetical protein